MCSTPRFLAFLMSALLPILAATAATSVPPARSSAEILWGLQKLERLGRALYVAAHPDDENTALISYLSLGGKYDTAYLSLTRGDGGQNLIGSELGDQLGVIRTQELVEARRLDGGRQFFASAKDFGYSKTAEETMRLWDEEQVLSEMVWVIRSFRPDVIITRFRTEAGGTHGHHTASARLAVQAFEAAADPAMFPEQLKSVGLWQAKRVVWNASSWFFRNNNQAFNESEYTMLEVGGYEPLLGRSYNEIASLARSMHRSQGFGTAVERGSRKEYFRLLAGEPMQASFFDGVDTSWDRVAGGREIGDLARGLVASFKPLRPEDSIVPLLDLRDRLRGIDDPWALDKASEIDGLVASCLGLSLVARSDQPTLTPDSSRLVVSVEAIQRSSMSASLVAAKVVGLGETKRFAASLASNTLSRFDLSLDLPGDRPYTQPFWLREGGSIGMFAKPSASEIGVAENGPTYRARVELEVAGRNLILDTPVVYRSVDPAIGESLTELREAPAASVSVDPEVALFANGAERAVDVSVDAVFGAVSGELTLGVPAGWRVFPAKHQVPELRVGDKTTFSFRVSPPAAGGEGPLRAVFVASEGQRYDQTFIRLAYGHIAEQFMLKPSVARAVALSVAKRGERVAYIEGAGDAMASSIAEIGYRVDTLSPAQITVESLEGYDAVVLGIRAYNTINDIDRLMPLLFEYVHGGGNVIVQYNTHQRLKTDKLAPYDLAISSGRVTDENATVTLLAPTHPALTTPNRITPADFEGWTQERGLYFPSRWASEFTPLLSMADYGESPAESSLLVARHGQGYFVYTGLSWFRQMPAGVPGAYRLFANLLSLGKE